MANDENNIQLGLEIEEPEQTQDISLAAQEEEDVPVIELAVDVPDSVSEKKAEAWAVGERNGVPVGSEDVTYHNNAKWYAESIVGDAEAAAASAASAAADAEAASHYGARYATTIPWDDGDNRKIAACAVTYDMTIDELLAMGGS